MQKFSNLKQLMAYFADEKVCLDFLEEQLWNGKPVCPHCGSERVYRLADGKQFKCGNKKTCDKRFNVLTKTMYENTKLPLSVWFGAVYLLTAHKKGISSYQLARDLGVTQKTGWFILHRVREMAKIGHTFSVDQTVQADETYVKGKARNRHKSKRKLIAEGKLPESAGIVFGLVNEKAVMRVVPNAQRTTLNKVINEVVPNKETVMVTDGFTAYLGLDEIYKGHIIINHAQDEYKVGEYHTNTVEGLFSILKRGIYGIYHHVSAKHLQRYCDEFAHRYNSRKIKDADRFTMTIQQSRGRLKYFDLIQKEVTCGHGESDQKSEEKGSQEGAADEAGYEF
jgi:transposase-like protein